MSVVLVWILLCIIWGTTWIFIKIGLTDLPPISFAAMRFLISVAILFPIVYFQKLTFPKTRRDWTMIGLSGIFQFFFNYGLLFWGEQYISSGLAAVLQSTIPAFGLVIARLYIPDEKITLLKVGSIFLGIAGVVVIFREQLELGGWLSLWGGLAVVVGALMAAYASVLTKTFGRGTPPASLVLVQMVAGVLPLCIAGFSVEGSPVNFHWTTSAVICLLYLAIIGSIVAFWLYYWLMARIDVTKAMMISLVTPLIAVIIGDIYLGEKLEVQTIIGGILVLMSIGLIVLKPLLRRRGLKEATESA